MPESTSLFPSLNKDDIQTVSGYGMPRRYAKNSILINKGDESDGVYVIQQGKVKVYAADEYGGEIVFRHQGPDELFGELALFDDCPRTASVATLEECRLIYVGRSRFEQCLKEHPDLSLKFIRHMIGRITSLTDDLADCALKTVYERVKDKLINMAQAEGDRWIVPDQLTHLEIAGLVGSGREMVSRVMKKLSDKGYIEVDKKRIVILKDLPRHLPG